MFCMGSIYASCLITHLSYINMLNLAFLTVLCGPIISIRVDFRWRCGKNIVAFRPLVVSAVKWRSLPVSDSLI